MRDPIRLYRESAVRGASPVGLIVILYDEVLLCIRRAQRALEMNNIESRALELSHAIRIIGHLQSVLDFQAGGEVARNISRFYDIARAKALEANLQSSPVILQWLSTEFSEHLLAWKQVDRAVSHSEGDLVLAGRSPESEEIYRHPRPAA